MQLMDATCNQSWIDSILSFLKSIIHVTSAFIELVNPVAEKIFEVINSLGGACLTVIGLYTFYRTFISKKIRFLGFGTSSSIWDGYAINVDIQNYSLSALSVKKISLIIDDDYEVKVKGYSDPLLLEPLKTVKIESDRMSTDPFEKSRLFDKNIKLRVYCSGGKVLTVKYKRLKKQWKKPKEYRPKMVINQHFGDVLVTEHMKYVVYIISPEEKTTSTFINKAGFIRDSIKGFNGIPKEIVDDPEKVVEALEGLLGDGYKVVLKDIALFFSDEEETDED